MMTCHKLFRGKRKKKREGGEVGGAVRKAIVKECIPAPKTMTRK